jgi:transcriptional regulator with XRE-family HTH domain
MLGTYGIGIPRTRELSGVSNGSISRLLYGRGEEGPSRRVRTQTADRILAIKPSLDAAAPSALVDGTGTRRRLQALVAMGWPQKALSRRLGLDRNTVNDQVNSYTPAHGSTARAVRDLYDELWNVDPLQAGVGKRWVAEAKALAKARGWAPPGAWDDDYIDSPAAVPDVGEHVAQYVSLTENAEWLITTQGYTTEQAAHRLGVTRAHLARAQSYARHKGVAA